MTAPTVILIGPHGVGKSTLGPVLADRLGVPFHGELGREMAEDPAWRRAGETAEAAQAAFDQELMTREVARDLSWGGGGRVIETWHPGNLAFAVRRSPEVAAQWLPTMRLLCGRAGAVVVPLMASAETLRSRQTEPGRLTFFVGVAHVARRWASDLGLRVLPPLFTELGPPEALATVVAHRIARRPSRRPTPHLLPWS